MVHMNPISRRDMIKLGSAGSFAALAGVAPESAAEVLAPDAHPAVAKWDLFEVTLQGPSSGNPFTEVELSAIFALEHRTVQVDGFYDGAGSYKLRFMPDAEGEWSYSISSNAAALDGLKGKFLCGPAAAGVHGILPR